MAVPTKSRYVALLRGINVGGHNAVAMPELRALAEHLGYGDVRTYINTGNLIFTAVGDSDGLAVAISDALTAKFGRRIDVTVRDQLRLSAIMAANPFPQGEPSQVTVAFLTASAGASAEADVRALAAEYEPVVFTPREVYVNYTHGIGTSVLAARFSKAVGVGATVRNVRTLAKILQLMDD